jgi:hypothetical protein
MDEASDAQIATGKRDEIRCPSCDAVLMKVEAAPGAKIRCPNCAHRFESMPSVETGSSPQQAAPGREPKSPGYWLLRIPAVIALLAGIIIPLIVAHNLYREIFDTTVSRRVWRSPNSLEFWMSYSYVPLTTVAGVLSFYLTRALARIDASMLHFAWRSGVLREPLPPVPGSSLPTIAPPAVLGGILPLFSEILMPGELVPCCVMGAALLYLGFALEDLRQFAWRQQLLAGRLNVLQIKIPTRSLFTGLAFAFAGGGWGLFCLAQASRRYSSDTALIFIGLACGALGISLCVIGRAWDAAVGQWLGAERKPVSLPFIIRRVTAFPLFWAAYGVVWMLLSWMFADVNLRDNDFISWLFISVGCVALAVALSRTLAQVNRWRTTIHSKIETADGAHASNARLSIWQQFVVWSPWLLSIIEAGIMGTLLFEEVTGMTRWRTEIEWRFLFALPIILGMVHYPAIWLATVVREFLLLERTLESMKPSDDLT